MNAELRIGVITKTHGIRGEVKVYPTTDSPMRFEELSEVTLLIAGKKKKLRIESVRYFKNLVILKFEGINNINDVEPFRGGELYIPREQGEALGTDEYYIADLIGLRVVTEDGMQLGVVRDVLETGANDVYIVTREGMKDLLLPAIHDCIKAVDLEAGQMTIHLMEGLLDLYQ